GAVRAVLSTTGGWLQFSPLWDPLTKWLGPAAAPIAVPTNTEEWVASGTAVALGLLGIGIAWALYAAKRVPVPKPSRLLEKKFYWDEIYDYLFYYPSDLLARGLYAFVE